jgi:hypothetical protein
MDRLLQASRAAALAARAAPWLRDEEAPTPVRAKLKGTWEGLRKKWISPDGGIDLPVPSANGAAIYQIKGFTGNLT